MWLKCLLTITASNPSGESLHSTYPSSKTFRSLGNQLECNWLYVQSCSEMHSVPPLHKAPSWIETPLSSLLTLSLSLQPDTNYILPWPTWQTPQALFLHAALFFPPSALFLPALLSSLAHILCPSCILCRYTRGGMCTSVSYSGIGIKVCCYAPKTSWFQHDELQTLKTSLYWTYMKVDYRKQVAHIKQLMPSYNQLWPCSVFYSGGWKKIQASLIVLFFSAWTPYFL